MQVFSRNQVSDSSFQMEVFGYGEVLKPVLHDGKKNLKKEIRIIVTLKQFILTVWKECNNCLFRKLLSRQCFIKI